MISIIEPLYKTKNQIKFGWASESGATAYRIYVGLSSLTLVLLYDGLDAQASKSPVTLGKVACDVEIADVRTVLTLASTVDFTNTVFFFAITYKDSVGSWSATTTSTIVEVPPVGIIPRYMKDDPTTNRHEYFFSDMVQKWVKAAGTSTGALYTSTSNFFADNLITDYVYDGTNITGEKIYPSDMTTAGSPAKLITYTYSGSNLIKKVISDSTV